MAMISLGDMAQTFLQRRQNIDLKAEVQRRAQEMTTGIVQDVGRHVGGDFAPLAGIESALARLQGFARATSEAGLFTGAMQTALSTVEDVATTLAPVLFSAATSANAGSVSAAAREARQGFDTVVSMYNTRLGDRALFAGDQTAQSPLVDADTLLSQMEVALGGALTLGDVEAALDTWFADPLGFMTQAYQGGAALADLPIGPGQSAKIDVTATDPAIRETLKGFAMAALVDRGLFASQGVARVQVMRRAGEVLAIGASSRAQMAGRLGTTEGQIAAASTRNTAEVSALEIARNGLVSVDPYEAATKLEAAQSQLEALYTVTARLSRLNLVDFLR
jgi:flagellar hook-associated protein 3 FlgL